MKKWSRLQIVLWLFICMSSVTVMGQSNVLIPYRDGNLFGLANKEGKVLLKPAYHKLQIMGGGYFKYWKQVKAATGNEEEEFEIGVLAGTKPIIQEEGLTHFVYLAQGIIIGTANLYNSNNCKFYDVTGKPFFKENFKTCRVVNPSSQEKGELHALALLVEKYDESISILIFDPNTKDFTTPLLENVRGFSLQAALVPRYISVINYMDADNRLQKDMFYYNYATQKHVRAPFQSQEALYKLYQSPEVSPKPKTIAKKEMAATETLSPPYFRFESKTHVKRGEYEITLAANESIVPISIYSNQAQEQLPILKQGKQYALLLPDLGKSKELYDSLVYVKQLFNSKDNKNQWCYLAAKRSEQGVLQWGILNEKGDASVPLMYDSIGFKLAESSYFEGQGNYQIKYPGSYVTYAPYIENSLLGLFLVKKNGKYGLVNLVNEEIVAVNASKIWRNNISIPEILGLEERFYVYQQANSYGVFQLSLEGVVSRKTGPVFIDIPVAFYPNYMEIPGLDIYFVIKNQELFFGLVSDEGKRYYR